MKESVPRWKGFAGSFQNTPGNHKEHYPPIFLLFVHVCIFIFVHICIFVQVYVPEFVHVCLFTFVIVQRTCLKMGFKKLLRSS